MWHWLGKTLFANSRIVFYNQSIKLKEYIYIYMSQFGKLYCKKVQEVFLYHFIQGYIFEQAKVVKEKMVKYKALFELSSMMLGHLNCQSCKVSKIFIFSNVANEEISLNGSKEDLISWINHRLFIAKKQNKTGQYICYKIQERAIDRGRRQAQK